MAPRQAASHRRGISTLRGINITKPSATRVYDWYLGGGHHWAIDRYFGRTALQAWPEAASVARQNRYWLGRVVHAALQAGITQFLDLGCGLPAAGSVPDLVAAHQPHPPARVLAVDCDPLVLAHSRTLLEARHATGWCGVAEADLREPTQVLSHPETRRLLDLSRPVCVLLGAVLHYIPGTEAVSTLLAGYRSRLPAGSWLALSHLTTDHTTPASRHALERFCASYTNTLNTPLSPRTRRDIQSWLPAASLLPPGLVAPPDWRPDTAARTSDATAAPPYAWCAVSRLPFQQ